jgi:hypothetical protein
MDIPRETITQLSALGLPNKTFVAVLGIITNMLASKPQKGTVMPESWFPDGSDVEYGIALGLSEDQIDAAAQNMRLWAGANRNRSVARKADWGLTFKGWLRREAERCKPKKNGISRTSMLDIATDLGSRDNGPAHPRTRVDEHLLSGFGSIGANGHAQRR